MLDRPWFATSHDLATLDGVEKSERTTELNDGWLTESFSRPRVHPRSVVRRPSARPSLCASARAPPL